MEEIFKKQFLLTGYLEYLITSHFNKSSQKSIGFANVMTNIGHNDNSDLPTVDIITPSDPYQRGSQLSLSFSVPLACVQEELQKRGIVVSVQMCTQLSNSINNPIIVVRHSNAECYASRTCPTLQFLQRCVQVRGGTS